MKKTLLFLLILLPVLAMAQEEKITLKPKVNIEFETSANANFVEGEFESTSFNLKRLRLEFKGSLTDNLSYHVRTAYHKKADPFTLDKISKSVELAKITWAPNEKFDMAAGKLFVEHAGYENYVNVLLIREFTDFNDCIEVYHLPSS